jgi:SEC-C motif-containing protein
VTTPVADSAACPCGSASPEALCCGALHAGAPAPTALALMRSRYAAFVRADMAYLHRTHDPDTRGAFDRAGAERFARSTTWTGLEIVATEGGGETDARGVVEFIARGVTRGATFAQHERSTFRRVAGAWVYVGGELVPAQRPVTRVGRNEPCPCGSGKKAKRCCGA